MAARSRPTFSLPASAQVNCWQARPSCKAPRDKTRLFVQAALFPMDTGGQRLVTVRGALDGPASSLLQSQPEVEKLPASCSHPPSPLAHGQLLDFWCSSTAALQRRRDPTACRDMHGFRTHRLMPGTLRRPCTSLSRFMGYLVTSQLRGGPRVSVGYELRRVRYERLLPQTRLLAPCLCHHVLCDPFHQVLSSAARPELNALERPCKPPDGLYNVARGCLWVASAATRPFIRCTCWPLFFVP